MLLLWIILSTATFAGDCDAEYRQAVETGPLDADELRYRMKCEEKGGDQAEEQPYICAITALPKYEERRKLGALPATALYSPGKSYDDIVGLWHPHKGSYRTDKNETIDVTVTANNYGTKVIKRKRSITERITLSLLDATLVYEKSGGGKPTERRSFSCSKLVFDDAPVEPEQPKSRWKPKLRGNSADGKADPGKRGTGPNKSGISGSY